MDRNMLMEHLRRRFEAEFGEALDAVEHAPEGAWIEACEVAFREAAMNLARDGFELTLQAKAEAPAGLEDGASR